MSQGMTLENANETAKTIKNIKSMGKSMGWIYLYNIG